MGRIELLEPLFQGGLRNTNFFNGRLLSAEDLHTEQEAARAQAARLGKAVGAGVVSGLRVSPVASASPPGSLTRAVVRVSAGLAVNRAGQSFSLPVETEVALVRERDTAGAEAGLFGTCGGTPATETVVAGAGAYVLTIRPASGFAGKALASGLGGNPLTSPGCGSRYAVEGVQFRFVDLKVGTNARIEAAARQRMLDLMSAGDAASLSRLRSELANACFGTRRLEQLGGDPFGVDDDPETPAPPYGALAALEADGRLDPCDVPLAVVYWSANGIEFADAWSVRRRPTRAGSFDRWSPLADERRISEGEAAFQQFQQHAEDLLATAFAPQSLRALDHFRYLPPVGVIPLALSGSSSGFDYLRFFDGMTFREPVFADGARLPALLRAAWAYPPVDLHNPADVDSKEMFWLYNVRQNVQAGAEGATPAPQLYMIFSSGQMPFVGEPRYDVTRWNYGNYI